MDIQASLGLRFAALQKSVDATRQSVDKQTDFWSDYYRGIKWMRLPLTLQGKAVGGVLNLGQENPNTQEGQVLGPEQGFCWSLRRLIVDGLTSGATPDVVNLFRSTSTGQPALWQFNGNNFGYTCGRLEMVLWPGNTLQLISVGTFAATGTVRLSGELIEIPAEQLAKLA